MVRRFILVLCFLCIIIQGCGIYSKSYKNPDDAFAKKIDKDLGDDFRYYDKRESDDGTICYVFEIKNKDENAVSNFYKSADDYLCKCVTPVIVQVNGSFSGGCGWLFCISNFYINDNQIELIKNGYRLNLRRTNVFDDSYDVFFDPITYTVMRDIKVLEIDNDMNESAKQEGIDWYEIWSGLEMVIVDD